MISVNDCLVPFGWGKKTYYVSSLLVWPKMTQQRNSFLSCISQPRMYVIYNRSILEKNVVVFGIKMPFSKRFRNLHLSEV